MPDTPAQLTTPTVAGVPRILDTLDSWQLPERPFQLHSGDVGWFGQHGDAATAAALRVWARGDDVLAIGLLDGPDMLRVTHVPELDTSAPLIRQLAHDIDDPGRGVLPGGGVSVEMPSGSPLYATLGDATVVEGNSWAAGESWAVLVRPLDEPVPDAGVRLEPVTADTTTEFAKLHRAAFSTDTFTSTWSEERFLAMAAGPAYAQGAAFVARSDRGAAVGHVTIWSAGQGRAGILEPMGVAPEHRGHGYGRAICLAAAAELRARGAASAGVATPASNAGAVATYASAGFRRRPDRLDRTRLG